MKNLVVAIDGPAGAGKSTVAQLAAKKLGFTRRGTKVDQALNEALDILTSEHAIENIDGMFRMKE